MSDTSSSNVITGWQGRLFEDFEVGQIYKHPQARTVTHQDNLWMTMMTLNPNPIHYDYEYAADTEWGKPLVNSCFTLSLVTALSVADLSQNAVNLGWDEVRLPHPVFDGDTIYAQSEILETRESKSRPHQGIVKFKTIGFNQEGKAVISFTRTILLYKKGHMPAKKEPPALQE